MPTIAILIMASIAAAQTGDPSEVQLREAMHKEVMTGDLKGAIELYRKIAERKGASRSAVAQALLHLGQCQEKLGAAEARKTYDRLVRDFADQPESVSAARTRLAALGSEPVRASGVTFRHIWSGPALGPFSPTYSSIVGISPDARYISYADATPGRDLMLRNLADGQVRPLTRDTSGKEGAEGSVFSPDGNQIAYCWIGKDNEQLHLIRTDGTGMRVLYNDRKIAHLDPVAWSPDQKHILIFTEPYETARELVLVSTADGSTRSLKTIEGNFSWRASFSPDGRFIVYDRSPTPRPPARDLFVISVETGQEIPLVQHPADDYLLGWVPDGSGVLFVSNRTSASPAIWFQAVAQGKAHGEPSLVRQITGILSAMAWTRNGSLFYKLNSTMSDLQLSNLDPATGKATGVSTAVSTRTVGNNLAAVWSPDGRKLAYRAAQPSRLVIRSMSDGAEHEIDVRNPFWSPQGWSADGASVFLNAAAAGPGSTILRVDVASGVTSSVFTTNDRDVWCGNPKLRGDQIFCFNDRAIITRHMQSGETTTIVADTRGRDIWRNFDVSADGKQVAYVSERRALKVTAVGGETRELHRLEQDENWVPFNSSSGMRGGVAFTPDGRYVVFSKTKAAISSLWRVPVDGGEATSMAITGERLHDFTMSPDGRQIVFSDYKRLQPELWVMENLLPSLRFTR